MRYIGQLRTNTAAQTDERVRLTSEAIDGVLAAKMMSEWPVLSCSVLSAQTPCLGSPALGKGCKDPRVLQPSVFLRSGS